MKNIVFALIVLLFVWTTACKSKIDLMTPLFPEGKFVGPFALNVDGETFAVSGQYVLMKDSGQKYFVLIVCPESQKGKYKAAIGYETKISTGKYNFLGKLIGANDKEFAKARPDTVYFIDDGKIRFSRNFEELDTGFTDPLVFLKKENLVPTLENLIRENLPKNE